MWPAIKIFIVSKNKKMLISRGINLMKSKKLALPRSRYIYWAWRSLHKNTWDSSAQKNQTNETEKNFENLWKSYPIRDNVLSSRLRFHMISWKNQNNYVRVYFLTLKKTLRIWHDREPLRKTITPYLLGLHDVSLSKEYYSKFALLDILIAFEKH